MAATPKPVRKAVASATKKLTSVRKTVGVKVATKNLGAPMSKRSIAKGNAAGSAVEKLPSKLQAGVRAKGESALNKAAAMKKAGPSFKKK